MKYISFFTGIGGFELGIQQAHVDVSSSSRSKQRRVDMENGKPTNNNKSVGTQQPPTCVGYSEIDKYAIQIYESHFNHKNFGDITRIREEELPDFDLICGGFPCQSFSIAGKRGGFEDTRGTLFFDIARLIKAKRPRLILLENVKGLLSHDNGKTFNTIILTLDELGYDLQWQVLNSKNFGVPQNRERVFIIGHLRGTPRPKVFPIQESDGGDIKKVSRQKSLRGRNKNTSGCLDTRGVNAFDKADLDKIIYDYDNIKIRRPTPTEFERLQGFPDSWTEGVSDSQRYKVLGNAVTVNVIKEIAKRLL